MTTLPPAGWYPDPVVPGAQRYFDGAAWTQHVLPPAPPPGGRDGPLGPQAKGAEYGLPATGPGSLATPGRRLGARCLDGLVLAPVFVAISAAAIAVVAPHAGPMLPNFMTLSTGAAAPGPTPGLVWIALTVVGSFVVTGMLMVAYETVATAKWGRTLGKKWLHIRPVRTDGDPLGWGRAFGRVALYWLSGFLGWFGLLDPLWCLWDANHQCIHDKAVGTLVINDPVTPPHPVRDLRAGPTAIPATSR